MAADPVCTGCYHDRRIHDSRLVRRLLVPSLDWWPGWWPQSARSHTTVCAGVAPRSAVTASTGVSIRITGMTSATERYRDHDDDSSSEQAPRQQSSPFVPREGQGETSYEDEKRREKLGGRPNDLATAHSRSISAGVSIGAGRGAHRGHAALGAPDGGDHLGGLNASNSSARHI